MFLLITACTHQKGLVAFAAALKKSKFAPKNSVKTETSRLNRLSKPIDIKHDAPKKSNSFHTKALAT